MKRRDLIKTMGLFGAGWLFIFQGDGDPLFPPDLFFHTARKIRPVYRAQNADQAFEARVMTGSHSWDAARNVAVGQFLARQISLNRLPGRESENEPLLCAKDRCLAAWPTDALTTDALAEQLTGRRVKGVPVEQRVFGTEADGVRPPFVQFVDCKRVLIEGITLKDSPSWTVHPVYCEDVVVRGITIASPATRPNTDGINPDSCRNVLIADCVVGDGDNCPDNLSIQVSFPDDEVPHFGCELQLTAHLS